MKWIMALGVAMMISAPAQASQWYFLDMEPKSAALADRCMPLPEGRDPYSELVPIPTVQPTTMTHVEDFPDGSSFIILLHAGGSYGFANSQKTCATMWQKVHDEAAGR